MRDIVGLKRIKQIINEAYFNSVKNTHNGKSTDVYTNSDRLELSKLLKEFKSLRFVIWDGNYYVWDYHSAIHQQVEQSLFGFEIDTGFKGFINTDSVYLYVDFAYDWLDYNFGKEIANLTPEEKEDYEMNVHTYEHTDEIVEEFKQTSLGKRLESLGIDDFMVSKWL